MGSMKNCARKGAERFMAKTLPVSTACPATFSMLAALTVRKNPELYMK